MGTRGLNFDQAPAAPAVEYLDQSLLRLSGFHMRTGVWLVHVLTAFRSFNHSTNEVARFGHWQKKKFELCEKARQEQLSRVQNQKAEHFYRPCWAFRTYLGKNALGF
jgi:hypothetical protein